MNWYLLLCHTSALSMVRKEGRVKANEEFSHFFTISNCNRALEFPFQTMGMHTEKNKAQDAGNIKAIRMTSVHEYEEEVDSLFVEMEF